MGQLLVAAASPILTRVYSARELGTLSVYASLLATLVPMLSLRYEVAIPLPEEDTDALNVLLVAVLCLLATSSLILVAALVFGGPIASLTGAQGLEHYLWLLPIGLAAAGTYQALSYWGIRKGLFGGIGRARVMQSVGQVSSQVGLGVGGAGSIGLLVGDVIGRSSGATALMVSLARSRVKGSDSVSWQKMRDQARRYRRFPLFGSWAALANAAGLHLTPFLIAASFGVRAAGFWTVGQRVMSLPSTIIGQAVGQVYLGEAAIIVRSDRDALRPLYLKTAKRLALVGVLLLLPAGLLAPLVFPFVFGSQWHQTGVYMALAAVMFFAQFVASPLSQTLNVVGRQDLQLAWDVSRLAVMLTVFLLAGAANWSDVLTIAVFAGAMATMYAVLGVVTLRVSERVVAI